MVENRILRENARAQLGNNIFASGWLNILLAFFIVSAIMGALLWTGIGSFIVAGPLMYGMARVTVNKVKNPRQNDFNDLFIGFKENFGGSLVLWLLMEIFIALWSLLFIIPGIVKSYSYAMSFYIQQDEIGADANECITKSRKMMHGHKWQLFCLDFSFIGWYILGILCFGVGVLFVEPYHEMARANFYMALKAELEPQVVDAQVEEPDAQPETYLIDGNN